MIKGKKTAGCPQNSYIGQIKNDVRIKTFKEFRKTKETGMLENWSCKPTTPGLIKLEKKIIKITRNQIFMFLHSFTMHHQMDKLT